MVLKAIDYDATEPSLKILNQLVLPHDMIYLPIPDCEAAHEAIRSMKVRGAPAIALVAILALAVELSRYKEGGDDVRGWIHGRLDYLVTSRPTAVNLHDAARKLKRVVDEAPDRYVPGSYTSAAEKMLRTDVEDNLAIGRHGARHILEHLCESGNGGDGGGGGGDDGGEKISVLTLCNTGSLATAGYGTAYSVLCQLHAARRLTCAYFCETRPYNQGARLTSTELLYDGIPSTMVIDSSVAALLSGAKRGRGSTTTTMAAGGDEGTTTKTTKTTTTIAAIVVGADRVARNGDTANKIGTQQLAILAHHFRIPFLVAAPWTTIDLDTASGEEIVIEERPAQEVRRVYGAVVDDVNSSSPTPSSRDGNGRQDGAVRRGCVEICGDKVDVWNPAFDVTPHAYISGIVTERGVYVKNAEGAFDLPGERGTWSSSSSGDAPRAKEVEKVSTVSTSVEESQ